MNSIIHFGMMFKLDIDYSAGGLKTVIKSGRLVMFA